MMIDENEWVTETPEELYEIVMWSSDEEVVQLVELTREEYIALKQHLAQMRGLVPETCQAATPR